MGYRLLVDAILVAHAAFLVYVVAGGFLAWRWARAWWPHLAAGLWGFAVVVFSLSCPLTWAENRVRELAGEHAATSGFIDRYVKGVLFPARYTHEVWALCAVVVLVSWVGVWRRWRAGRASRGQRRSATRPATTANATSASRNANAS